jgi:hypothetical protein
MEASQRHYALPMAAPTTPGLSTAVDVYVCWEVDVKAH